VSVRYEDPRSEMVRFVDDTTHDILDVGCSSGVFGRGVKTLHPTVRLVGVEPNAAAAELAQQHYEDVVIGTFPEALKALSAAAVFDVIFFNDVLEHMTNPEAALRAALGRLKPGGIVVSSIPNIRHVSVLGPLVLQGRWRYRDSGLLDRTHVYFFTEDSIRSLYAAEGWHIVEMTTINLAVRPGRKTPGWVRALTRLTRGRSDAFFAMQYVTVARPSATHSRPQP
jgi:2-polyprenyl-3-methyl-5-hydroxy-6-metoxy-1,4-benzoquinol methylase